jgi:hypothetical protein
LSEQAYHEYQGLQEYIQTIQVEQDTKDSWSYLWGSSNYTSSRFYHLPYKNYSLLLPFSGFGIQSAATNSRVFSWLLLMDRLNTRNILRRKKLKLEGNNYKCVLCSNNVEETAHHLLFSCHSNQECWQQLGIQWNLQTEFFQMMIKSKQQHQNPFFMETFIIAAWHIRKQRNNFIFDRGRPSFSSWKN